jgi:hypothetical protein
MTARLSDGLREIADLLDKHPEIQQADRFKGQHSDLSLFTDSPVVLAELAASIGRKVDGPYLISTKYPEKGFTHGTISFRTSTVALHVVCLSGNYEFVTTECCRSTFLSTDDMADEHNIHYEGSTPEAAGPDAWYHNEGFCSLDMYGFPVKTAVSA